MKVAVLGGHGVIGSQLISELKSHGFDVVAPDRATCDLALAGSTKTWFRCHRPDWVIYCAAHHNRAMDPFDPWAARTNISMFTNVYMCKQYFGSMINIGSGAEFDRRNSIDSALESLIFECRPQDHYGMSKNVIARVCADTPNFFNLRLFGLQHAKHTLWQKIWSGHDQVELDPIEFDWFSWRDFILVLEYFLTTTNQPKDINLVYPTKLTLLAAAQSSSRLASQLIETTTNHKNYTGDGSRLSQLNLALRGLE